MSTVCRQATINESDYIMQVPCRCCNLPIDIELQIRVNLRTGEQRAPIFLVTCRNKECGLHNWTFAFEDLNEYQVKDLDVYLKPQKYG